MLSLGISLATHPSLVFLIELLFFFFFNRKTFHKSTSSIQKLFHSCIEAEQLAEKTTICREGKDDFA